VAEIHQLHELTGHKLSIHGSVYAPEDYIIDRLGIEATFMAMLSYPDKCREILTRHAHALCKHVSEQIDAGADAINFSAPWTGQNFISLDMYEKVIAPAQGIIAQLCKDRGVPCYCHTCGEIDDRLELIIDIGFAGVECLDPPPLGNVELEDAVKRIGDRAFIKGNIDPVNVLMNGTPEQIREDAIRRLEIGMKAKGFILSTACSVAPATSAENLEVLYEVVEKYGYY
jgi:uroporphyrinogen-III decarboxylase